MSIKITDNNNKIHNVVVSKFSDGCYNVTVPDVNPICVSVRIEDAVIDMHLLDLVVGAYLEMGYEKLNHLFIPYVPNARADRVFNRGNAFPLKTTLSCYWTQCFKTITVYDLHSDISKNEFNKDLVVEVSQSLLVKDHCHHEFDVVCSPDKGAVLKATQVAYDSNVELIKANKIRDTSTGRIIKTELVSDIDIKDKTILIADDICDGGGTFIPLAKILKERGARSVILFVSHGIFAKGLDIFDEYIDKIYSSNIVCNYITRHDLQKFNMRKERVV